MTEVEITNTLVAKYGVVDTLHHYLAKANASMNSMSIALADKNPTLALSHLEKLKETISLCDSIVLKKENRAAVGSVKASTTKK